MLKGIRHLAQGCLRHLKMEMAQRCLRHLLQRRANRLGRARMFGTRARQM
jgi:hypothetical protein